MSERCAREFNSFERAVEAAFGHVCTKFGFCSVPLDAECRIKVMPSVTARMPAEEIVSGEGLDPSAGSHAGKLEAVFGTFFESSVLTKESFE